MNMSRPTHSYSQRIPLNCPSCGQIFDSELWLIIDTVERPDLVVRICDETIHNATCLYCSELRTVDLPLLIYQPNMGASGYPSLLFSPVSTADLEKTRQHMGFLVHQLRQSLGDEWQDAWIATGIPVVPRSDLAEVFGGEATMALPDAGEEKDYAAEEVRLLGMLLRFVNAHNWESSLKILEQSPDLLSEQTDALLNKLVEDKSGLDDSIQGLQEVQQLLRRCREIGTVRAFAEKMQRPDILARAAANGIAPEDFLAEVEAAMQLPPAVREALVELRANGVPIRTPEDLEQAMASRPNLGTGLRQLCVS